MRSAHSPADHQIQLRYARPFCRRSLPKVVLATILAASSLVWGVGCGSGKPEADSELFIYAGPGLRPAMTELVKAYKEDTGVTVACDYGGSGMILSRLRLRKSGDLFMPGDVWYVEQAEKEDLVASKTMVCYFVPVILVPKGNPAGIEQLEDLAKPDVRIGVGDPEKCQVGRLTQKLFDKNELGKEAIEKNTVYSSVTVNELGVQIKSGHLDAAIIWDAVAGLYPDSAEIVTIAPEKNIISNVAVGLLKTSETPEAAEKFIDFLTGERGQAIFKEHHYCTEPPD